MKNLALMTLLTMAITISAGAGEKYLPPGLQKKDKLPPGIAKKRGVSEDEHVRVVTNTVIVTNVVVAPPVREARIDLNARARTINTLDNKEAARRAGLAAIAQETGVSVSHLQAQRREHEGMGTAGLLMANAIAAKTKKPAGTFLNKRADGKPWDRIAADNNVSIEELDGKLARVEEAMRSVK